jgi:hypothetical protein
MGGLIVQGMVLGRWVMQALQMVPSAGGRRVTGILLVVGVTQVLVSRKHAKPNSVLAESDACLFCNKR